MTEQQRERDIAEMEAQMAHDTDQYFQARPQIMRTRDKETTFEAGFKAAWAARSLSHAEGEAVDHWAVRNPGLADQFRAEAKTVRKRLGFESDADDVSPNDLRERIAELEVAPDEREIAAAELRGMERAKEVINNMTVSADGLPAIQGAIGVLDNVIARLRAGKEGE